MKLFLSDLAVTLKPPNFSFQVVGKEKEMKTADAAIQEIGFALKQKGSPLQVQFFVLLLYICLKRLMIFRYR